MSERDSQTEPGEIWLELRASVLGPDGEVLSLAPDFCAHAAQKQAFPAHDLRRLVTALPWLASTEAALKTVYASDLLSRPVESERIASLIEGLPR